MLKSLSPFALSLLLAAPALADDPGAYLAGRAAAADSRFAEAATLYDRAIAADPDNAELKLTAVYLHSALGEHDIASELAAALEAADASAPHSSLILLAHQAAAGDWQAVLDGLEAGRQTSPVVDAFAQPWALFALGRMDAALDAFDTATDQQGLAAFGRQHKALAYALAGDMESANTLMADPRTDIGSSRILTFAHVEVLSNLDAPQKALALLGPAFDGDPEAEALRQKLTAGETLPFTQIRNPAHGLSAAILLAGGAHAAQKNTEQALLHARLAEELAPGDSGAILSGAEALLDLGRPDLAADTFDRIPPDAAARPAADLGRARALDAADQTEAGIAVLKMLTETHGDDPEIWSLLADMNRREGQYEAALSAYTTALDLSAEDAPARWILLYARGIIHHELDNWPASEADFRAALLLRPNQANVLNYLGYSLVERNEKLDEALGMIEKAVALDPDNGAIVDSLAWALFRLGRVEEAVGPMERAATLESTDPIVIDHLGDVLWAVGRTEEAVFQWRRALSFEPEAELSARIRRKLDSGLDLPLPATTDD